MKDWLLPALVTMFLWGIYGFLPKLTTQHISPGGAIFYEAIGGLCIGLLSLWYFGFPPEWNRTGAGYATLTGCIGLAGAFTYLLAAQHGKVSSVAVTVALYPIVTILIGVLVLKEPVSVREGCGMIMAIGAIFLLAF